jgi:dynactin complex subunit
MAALLEHNSELQQRVDAQRSEHATMLARMADVTSKWQATVAENARLNAALSAAKSEAAELQQLLMQCQQQQQQQQHCEFAYY